MILREARRFFRSSPFLSTSAIAVLALGIGASALALALLLAFSSLTYPGMPAIAYATIAEETEGGGSVPISWHRFEELRSASQQGTHLAAYSRPINTTVEMNGESKFVNIAAISNGFFPAFAPGLITGRDFDRVEESQAGRKATILSPALAVGLFGSPEKALGQFAVLAGLPYEVVGVASHEFRGVFGESVAAWVPANCVIPLLLKPPSGRYTQPDVWKDAGAFYTLVASHTVSSAELVAELSNSFPLRGLTGGPLHVSQGLTNDPVRDTRMRKWLRLGLLLAVVFTVVSSLNYSLLLLVRTPRYSEEVRLKKALGAGNGRLMADLMVGPTALVAAGLLAACSLCTCGLAAIVRLSGFYGQMLQGSWPAAFLAFGVQVPLACGLTLIIALIPILSLLRDNGAPRMGYTSTGTKQTGFLLQAVVTLQMAFCMGTWILAGMIFSSVTTLTREPLGFDPAHLTVICIRPTSGTVSFTVGAENKSSFPTPWSIESLLNQVAAIPGVRSASFSSNAPFGLPLGTVKIQRVDGATNAPRTVYQMDVSPGYFRTMGARIRRGRDFPQNNLAGDSKELVINETLARELWPNGDPVNSSVKFIEPEFGGMPSFTHAATIVGVVEDMRLSGFASSPGPTVFSSINGLAFFDITPYLVVSGSQSISSLQDVVSHEVPALMPGLGVQQTYDVDERARDSRWQVKQPAHFASSCALAMALVAYLGLYGALAYYVSSRRRELAIRICLGALPWAIRKIILVRAAGCTFSAAILSIFLWPILAQLSSHDYLGQASWSTARGVFISLACVSISVLVSLVPATNAASVSPSDVLKEQ